MFRTKSLIQYVGLIFLLAPTMVAQDKPFDSSSLSEAGRQAYQFLLKERVFAIGGVGYGGETSKGELALDVLIEEKNALDALRQLISDASSEGAVYGLFGLRMLGCECYTAELARLKSIHFSRENSKGFTTQSGCLVMPADNHRDKNVLLDGVIANEFSGYPALKNCRRETKGRKEDFARCVRGIK